MVTKQPCSPTSIYWAIPPHTQVSVNHQLTIAYLSTSDLTSRDVRQLDDIQSQTFLAVLLPLYPAKKGLRKIVNSKPKSILRASLPTTVKATESPIWMKRGTNRPKARGCLGTSAPRPHLVREARISDPRGKGTFAYYKRWHIFAYLEVR